MVRVAQVGKQSQLLESTQAGPGVCGASEILSSCLCPSTVANLLDLKPVLDAEIGPLHLKRNMLCCLLLLVSQIVLSLFCSNHVPVIDLSFCTFKMF